MDLIATLVNALLDISRVEKTAGDNDGAYRKQMRIILNTPGVQHAMALARARDAPAESAAAAQPKPARKRKPKGNLTA